MTWATACTPRLSYSFVITIAILTYALLFTPLFGWSNNTRITLWPYLATQNRHGVDLPAPDLHQRPHNHSRHGSLGVANKIYVISLPHRVDRRRDMERLRAILGLKFTYVSATSVHLDGFNGSELPGNDTSRNPLVSSILRWVKRVRDGPPFITEQPIDHSVALQTLADVTLDGQINETVTFAWPQTIDDSDTTNFMSMWDTSIWPAPHLAEEVHTNAPSTVACMTNDYTLPASRDPGTNDTTEAALTLPDHLILSPGKVACWHSHLGVIWDVANSFGPSTLQDPPVTIVLEDDVDMELDVRGQLAYLWKFLPEEWDIVFLGHCWSNESFHDAISPHSPGNSSTRTLMQIYHTLHPSHRPKCTHSYALSQTGARRLLLHLRYPPFAFSRAIDQALAWLVESGRLKAFSVVPSLIVQRKVGRSDVSGWTVAGGKGSTWRETLRNGALDGQGGQKVY